MGKPVGIILVLLVIGFVGYLGYGSWVTAQSLRGILTVGGPTIQGDGWPAPQSPADIGYVGDPKAAYGYDFEDVEIETELGVSPAWLVPAADAAASRWAIVVHGIGGRRENGYRFLPVLHDAGLPTLIITYRNDDGAQLSPDGLYAFGLTEWHDLDAAMQYAFDHGADDLVIVAESMGGGIAGQALLQSELADRIAAIVLDAPAVDFPAIVVEQVARLGLPLAPILARGGLWLSTLELPINIGSATTTTVFAEFAGPMFISHGEADCVVPVATSDALVERRDAPTEYLRTKADHIQSWKEDPARYNAALRAFLGTVQ